MAKRYYIDFERPIIELEQRLDELKKHPLAHQEDIRKDIEFLESQIEKLKRRTYGKLTPWQKVQVSRHPDRPTFHAYLETLFSDFIEIHGDRYFQDDPAVIGGLARLGRKKLVVIGQEKGTGTAERVKRNFGMPHPEGYRKAARLYQMAAKFGLPVVTFIDTRGAYAGIGAEERGQARALAECLRILSDLPTPIISINIGEGGSGGALAMCLADRLLMLEHAYYSVISPEGCAAILWQEPEKTEEAAAALSLTATKLVKMGIVDSVVDEPLGGAHRDPQAVIRAAGEQLRAALEDLTSVPIDILTERRYERYRRIGVFTSKQASGIRL